MKSFSGEPGSEYGRHPSGVERKLKKGFWREIENMKKMGFVGFFMHARVCLSTAYLSEEFMDCVSHCNAVAKSEGLLSYLYDEDKWPSGFGGGLVTKNIKYREKYLRFTRTAYGEGHERAENGELLAVYDIVLDKEGCLESYNIIGEADKAKGIKYYVYLEYGQDSNWYNGESYVDTMSAEAIKEFIKITHEKYKARLGGEFGKSVPAIFTDEPQFHKKDRLSSPYDTGDICLPFTTDFPVTYEKTYGEPLLPRLPELLWELPDNRISVSRYNYHDHTAERFAEAFSDTLGKWCEENGILLTGHMMAEPDLECQSAYVGDCMRQYRSFGMPGIDILCDKRQETTAKQAQSASNQYGREGVTSELYGVTNWDFDFAGHKMQGDWQAALGITLRVPHLYGCRWRGGQADIPLNRPSVTVA